MYLVIDLEATCNQPTRLPRDETEVIEIGAAIADSTGRVRDQFQTFVRPTRHPITAFCTELTTITPEDVANAPGFIDAIGLLEDFMAGRRLQFCSWGAYDRNQLRRQSSRLHHTIPWLTPHLNLKERFAKRRKIHRCGLGSALEQVGLTFEGTAHRGLDDALNIARLLPYCLT